MEGESLSCWGWVLASASADSQYTFVGEVRDEMDDIMAKGMV